MTVYRQDVIQAALRQNLFRFVWKTFNTLNPSEELADEWYLKALCFQLEAQRRGEVPRLLVTMPPRHLKSIVCSVAYPAWLLGHDPTLNILVVSYGMDLAAKHARDFRAVVESDWYRELFPRLQPDQRKNTETDFITTLRGGRKAVSLGGAITGFGANLLIVDDPMKTSDAQSPVERERTVDFYEQTLLTRLNDKARSQVLVVQQRQHQEDLAGHLSAKGTFEILSLPAIATERTRHQLGPDKFYSREPGEPLSPTRESLETLERIRIEVGNFVFASQYQQDPVPSGGTVLRWEWFDHYEAAQPRDWYQTILQSWDTAVIADPTSDFSACVTLGYREKIWYVVDVWRGRLEYPHLKSKVISMASEWRADNVVVEHANTGLPLVRELRSDGMDNIFTTKPRGDKVSRLAAQTALIESGKVKIPQGAAWLSEFRSELLGFPHARYDDQVDAFSQALKWAQDPKGRAKVERAANGGRRARRNPKRRSRLSR